MKKSSKLMLPLAIIAAVIIVFVIVVAMRPAEFRVTRSTSITAPASAVFAQVNDFHKWEAWSPWAKMDPAAKNSFNGATAGTGAGFAWSGNNKVGEGSMTIAESRPNGLIRINLEFLKPFKASSMAEFTFKQEGNQTVVTWSMSGKNKFIGKAISLFMDCDNMVGGQFEQGLANMKSVSEAAAKSGATSSPTT
jgi:hypothetical protein